MKPFLFVCCFSFLSLFTPLYAAQGSFCLSSASPQNVSMDWTSDSSAVYQDKDGGEWHDETTNGLLSYFKATEGSTVSMPELYEKPCGYRDVYVSSKGCKFARPIFSKSLKMALVQGYEFGWGAPKAKKFYAFSSSKETELPADDETGLTYNSDIMTTQGAALQNLRGNLVYFDGDKLIPFSVPELKQTKDGLTWTVFNDPNSKRSFLRSTLFSEIPFLYEIDKGLKLNQIRLHDNIKGNFAVLSTPKTDQTWIINQEGIYAEMNGTFERVLYFPEKHSIDTIKDAGYTPEGDVYFTVSGKSGFRKAFSLKAKTDYTICTLDIDFRKDTLIPNLGR